MLPQRPEERPTVDLTNAALESGHRPNVVLRVAIDRWDPLAGVIGPVGGGTEAKFEGWIGFMGAIDEFRPDKVKESLDERQYGENDAQ